MKRFAFFLGFLFIPLMAAAQPATLLDGDIDNGGCGGLVMKVAQVNGQAALMLGAEGNWIINHTFIVGVHGGGIVNRVDAPVLQVNGKPYLMWVNETGARLGYIYRSSDLVHVMGGAVIGAGSMQLADRYFWTNPERVTTYNGEDYYFLLEPEVAAELNVTSWMRARLGASYRIVSGLDTDGVSAGDLGGFAGSFGLVFGSF